MSTVIINTSDASLELLAASVWMAFTLWSPSASDTSILNVPETTVAVPRNSPLSIAPSLLASENSVTIAPVSPEPPMVKPLVFLVMLSVLDDPESSSSSARSSPVGLVGAVMSMTSSSLVMSVPTLFAASVAVTETLYVPAVSAVSSSLAKVHVPSTLFVAVLVCPPTMTEIVAAASLTVPVNCGVVSFVVSGSTVTVGACGRAYTSRRHRWG